MALLLDSSVPAWDRIRQERGILRVMDGHGCDLPKERLPSNSSTRADEIKASYASKFEA